MIRPLDAKAIDALIRAGGLRPRDVFHIEVDARTGTVTFGAHMRDTNDVRYLVGDEIATKTVVRTFTYDEPEYQI